MTDKQAVTKLGTYYLQTYGCQMNEYDSELLGWLLERLHYTPCSEPAEADIAVFNTCCVRDNADQKVYGRIGDFKNHKLTNPNQVLAVAGCLAQKDGEAFLERFPQVDVVVGTHNLQDLPDLIARVQNGEGRFVKVDRVGDHFNLPSNPRKKHSAMVTISMGCDQWCTFCIVPYVRGQLKSRPLPQVLSEVKRLAWEGHREILLLGQNVNDYGRDLEGEVDFADLIDGTRGMRGLDRLRFTSPHPHYFTQRVIDSMAANPAVCEHIHLPVQSGDDEVLKRMRRLYTQAEFLDLVARMRKAIPTLSLTTDIIVGYPGETEEQFQHTLDVVREVGFSSAFMFAYSPRPGTPGSLFKDQVPEDEKMDRLYRLIEVQNNLSLAQNLEMVGREFELLVEGPSKKDPTRFTGRTRCNRLVHFAHEGHSLTGHLVRVKLEKAYTWGFIGGLLEAEAKPGAWGLAANSA
ncbi:MAG: tRNA (N6-isopentenyl adenosine(37)-C2)-methylthiotransferase MiaB [Vulcanimicrobiota bacterium]